MLTLGASHARFPFQSQLRPETRERAPPAAMLGSPASHKVLRPLRLHSERLLINNMCLARLPARPTCSLLSCTTGGGGSRMPKKASLFCPPDMRAQPDAKALGKIWQLFVFFFCLLLCLLLLRISLVTLGAASKMNRSTGGLVGPKCRGCFGYTVVVFIDMGGGLREGCCCAVEQDHTHTHTLCVNQHVCLRRACV